jgi:hypothetical protein
MSQFGQDLYATLTPLAVGDDQRGFPVAILCGAFGEMFKDVEQVARAQPGREPYQQAFDINAAPTWLYPWLGQVVGVRDINGLSPALQKAKIIAEAGFYRGSVAALQAAIAATLTGTQTVRVVERTPDAWSLSAVTNPSETPNPTLTGKVAQAAKLAMVVLSVNQSSVPIVDQGTRTIDAATNTIDGAALSDIT